jgi:hypothetical protein
MDSPRRLVEALAWLLRVGADLGERDFTQAVGGLVGGRA